MLSKSLRAACLALLLGTGVVVGGTAALTSAAEAAARPAVGKLLNEAIRAAGAGNYAAARSAVSQAEAVGGLTPGDRAAIDQVKTYIAQKSGAGGAGGCAGLYLKGDYRGVVAMHGRDAQCMQLTAQAYYLMHDFESCTRYIRDNFGSGAGEQLLTLQMRCAYESQDNEGMRTALEQLVARTNKPDYWNQLLNTAQGTKGLKDHDTLDMLTGTLTKKDDYTLLAQLALQLGFAAEAQSVIQKGIDAKLLNDERTMRLMNMAKGQAAANAANAARIQSAGNGDALVKLGEDAWGQGRYDDALKYIQAGIAKGVTDKSNAQIRLGMAYLGGKKKDQAIRAFAQADGDAKTKVIAHLWEIYARTH